jgi:hypothetical protein
VRRAVVYVVGAVDQAALGGLMERVLLIEILAWYVVLGWRLFRARDWQMEPADAMPGVVVR